MKHLMQKIFLFSGLILLLGQMRLQASIVNDVDAVRQARFEQNEAISIGDVEHAALFWTDDVTMRRGLGTSIIGKEAYCALIDTAPNENSIIFTREPTCIEVSTQWPLAYESGTWTGRIGNAEGLELIKGSYSAQWVKREGRWLIRSEVFVALTCFGDGCAFSALP